MYAFLMTDVPSGHHGLGTPPRTMPEASGRLATAHRACPCLSLQKAKFLKQVKELSFGRTAREPCLKRIVSGKEWHRSSSFSEPYRATCAAWLASGVGLNERVMQGQ